jgi:zinc protease
VSAYQGSRELESYFLIAATAAPGHSLADISAAIDAELQTLADKGPSSDEMERAAAQIEAHFLYRLQTVGGFGGKSDQLNAYNVFCGDPAYFSRDVARYRDATQESVRATAARVLRFDSRVLLSVVPHGHQSLALAGSESVSVS